MEQQRSKKPVLNTIIGAILGIICIAAVLAIVCSVNSNGYQRPSGDLSNLKQLSIAVQMYMADYDDMMPLAHGADEATGSHGYKHYKYVPYDWSENPSPSYRVDYSKMFVMNTLWPYVKHYYVMAAPGMDEYLFHDNEGVVPVNDRRTRFYSRSDKEKGTTTYAYNGYLHAYEHDSIVDVSQLPLFTAANGNRVGVGVGFANPALTCATAYEPCYYKPRTEIGCEPGNGGKGAMYTKFDGDNSSYWLYKKGQNWAFNDAHAKFRRLGASPTSTKTDWQTDPWTNYTNEGHADKYWYDGCHAWLFRPDYDFEE